MPRPRSRVFPRLEHITLTFVVHLILKCCRKNSKGQSRKIQALSKSVPVCLANEYMTEIISVTLSRADCFKLSLRNALCPWCTSLHLHSSRSDLSVASSLDRLKHLTNLTVTPSNDGFNPNGYDMVRKVARHLPRLHKLRSLRLDCTVTDDLRLFGKVLRDCPCLEELSFQWGLSLNQPVTLGSCQQIKRVSIKYTGMSVGDVLYILLTVPQLHTLTIQGALLNPVLKTCQGPYRIRRLMIQDCDVAVSDLDSLTYHFPCLEHVRISGCGDLSAINSLHLKELALSECTPCQLSVLDPNLFSRLVSLRLTEISDLQALLKSVSVSLGSTHNLALTLCNQVDLVSVNRLFPGLRELTLRYCHVAAVPDQSDFNSFKHLEKLIVTEEEDTVEKQTLSYLVSHSSCLEHLEITQQSKLDDSTVQYMLQRNPMSHMKHLSLTSDALTPSVVSVVFDYFGENLVSAEFGGQLMEDLPPEVFSEIQNKIKPYWFNIRIGAKVNGILIPGSTMYLAVFL